ncbi:MAG: helix-turn-helix domain-containing protein [Clostridia bacterium]|nr:helix-turn-helix domain-containing protein [Clostridia bacterium]
MERLGDILRKTRLQKSLTIEQVANETKIRKDYIEAMENELWTVFPNYIYMKSFLRTYCRYLGLEKSEYVLYLINDLKPKPQPQQPPPEKIELKSAPQRKTGIVLGILSIVLLFAMSTIYQQYLNPFPNSEDKGIVLQEEQVEDDEQELTEWEQEQEQPDVTDFEGYPPEQGQTQDEEIEMIELTLKCIDDRCWVEVKNNADEFIYRRTIVKGEELSFTDRQKISVKLGNAGQVQVFLNGRDLGVLGEIGAVVIKTYILEDAEIKEL